MKITIIFFQIIFSVCTFFRYLELMVSQFNFLQNLQVVFCVTHPFVFCYSYGETVTSVHGYGLYTSNKRQYWQIYSNTEYIDKLTSMVLCFVFFFGCKYHSVCLAWRYGNGSAILTRLWHCGRTSMIGSRSTITSTSWWQCFDHCTGNQLLPANWTDTIQWCT